MTNDAEQPRGTQLRARTAAGRTGPAAAEDQELIAAEASSLRVAWPLWAVVATFLAIALVRSGQVDIPMRDPRHQLFAFQVPRGLLLVALLGVGDVLVRTWRAGWSRGRLVEVARARWPWRRVVLALTGILAYYTIYVSYRNLKSWDVLNTPRDAGMLQIDRALFLGHSPAVLLHDLLGTGVAATILSDFYSSFTYLVPTSLVLALGLIARVRQAYVFLAAACWTWILGTLSYYLIPTLGPFASAPQQFSHLRHTHVDITQAADLVGRQAVLGHPDLGDSFAGISAFASLHVGFTSMLFFVALYYGWRRTAAVLGVYVVIIVVSTIYFGWHFVLDDAAGVLMAYLAVLIGRYMVYPHSHGRPPPGPVAPVEEPAR